MSLPFDLRSRTGLVGAGERRDRAGLRPLDGPPVYQRDGLGPWGGRVRVEAWATRVGKTFRVIASWTGPELAGAVHSSEPVAATDLFDVDQVDHAVRVAKAAEDALRAPRRPDLERLARATR
jgi:hypothetical protein